MTHELLMAGLVDPLVAEVAYKSCQQLIGATTGSAMVQMINVDPSHTTHVWVQDMKNLWGTFRSKNWAVPGLLTPLFG